MKPREVIKIPLNSTQKKRKKKPAPGIQFHLQKKTS